MADTAAPLPPNVDRGPEILIICGTLVGISLLMVIVRLWVRISLIRQVGSDDYTMVAAMAVLFAEMMVIIPQVQLGGGKHKEYIQPPENITKGLHLNFVTQPLCLLALLLTKVSVGLFLLRMATTTGFRRFILGTIIFTILSATGNFLTVFFQCRPLAFTWDSSIPGGTCIPPGNLKFAAFFNSSVSVATDLLFALLPIPMLWNVQLNKKTKAAIAGILSLGIFATVAAIVKITFLSNYGKHGDFLFDSVDITIWTTVEICAAMVAACFPALKPLFKSLLGGTMSGKYGSKSRQGYIRNMTNNSTKRAYKSHNDDADFEMYNRQAKNQADVTGGYRSKMDSEESILQPHVRGSKHGDGITKTLQVSVTVDEYQTKSVKDLV